MGRYDENKSRYASVVIFMALSNTLAHCDISRVMYQKEGHKEYVYIFYDRTASYRKINVTWDSCWGMLKDVVTHIDSAELLPDLFDEKREDSIWS